MLACKPQINSEEGVGSYENEEIKIEPSYDTTDNDPLNQIFITEPSTIIIENEGILDDALNQISTTGNTENGETLDNDLLKQIYIKQEEVDIKSEEETNFDNNHKNNSNTSGLLNGLSAIQCQFCKEQFPNVRLLEIHLKKHVKSFDLRSEQQLKYVCSLCSEVFIGLDSLNSHKRSHFSWTQQYKCSVCTQVFLSTKELNSHKILHFTPKQQFKELRSHKNSHRQNEFKCNYCPESYGNLNSLSLHEKTNNGPDYTKCNICNKVVKNGLALMDHMKGLHPGVKQYKCNVCEIEFVQLYGYMMHKRMHSVDQQSVCEICGKTFARQLLLDKHMQLHTGVKPIKCELCGEGFASNQALVIHKKQHLDKTFYMCGICKKFFKTKSNYDIHVRLHTETTFNCKECNKKHTKRELYINHLKSHKDSRNECNSSGKDAKSKILLRNHMSTHSEKN